MAQSAALRILCHTNFKLFMSLVRVYLHLRKDATCGLSALKTNVFHPTLMYACRYCTCHICLHSGVLFSLSGAAGYSIKMAHIVKLAR